MGIPTSSRDNRDRMTRWASTTKGRFIFASVLFLVATSFILIVTVTAYGLSAYQSTSITTASTTNNDFLTSFGKAANNNHVKRSSIETSTPTKPSVQEFTITHTPIVTDTTKPTPTTTSANVSGEVLTYVYYSPRTWLTLAAVPHRSAVRQTRYSEMRKVVDYSMRSWTEYPYVPVQTVVSFFKTVTLLGPVTLGEDGVVGTVTDGRLVGLSASASAGTKTDGGVATMTGSATAGSATAAKVLPQCLPQDTGRAHQREHVQCTRPEIAYPTLFWIPANDDGSDDGSDD